MRNKPSVCVEPLEVRLLPSADALNLNSKAGASKTIFLDFDGNVLSGGSPWGAVSTPAFSQDADPAFSDSELATIENIWKRVAEDFAPFDVNVTTKDPGVDALTAKRGNDKAWGVRVCIGGSSYDWYGYGAGGVAKIGTFKAQKETPVFVFAENLYDNEKFIAEACSHEVGHSLGLTHDGAAGVTYYEGANGWAPIMGNSYYQELTQWSKGEYPGANNTQDDLAIISRSLPYRADDYSTLNLSASVSLSGIIERNTDTDSFRFNTAGGPVSFAVTGAYGSNLTIEAKLYDGAGTLVLTSTSFTTDLPAGTYTLVIDGVGGETYSDYASLGQYFLTAEIPAAHPVPSKGVTMLLFGWATSSGTRSGPLAWSVRGTGGRTGSSSA